MLNLHGGPPRRLSVAVAVAVDVSQLAAVSGHRDTDRVDPLQDRHESREQPLPPCLPRHRRPCCYRSCCSTYLFASTSESQH